MFWFGFCCWCCCCCAFLRLSTRKIRDERWQWSSDHKQQFCVRTVWMVSKQKANNIRQQQHQQQHRNIHTHIHSERDTNTVAERQTRKDLYVTRKRAGKQRFCSTMTFSWCCCGCCCWWCRYTSAAVAHLLVGWVSASPINSVEWTVSCFYSKRSEKNSAQLSTQKKKLCIHLRFMIVV